MCRARPGTLGARWVQRCLPATWLGALRRLAGVAALAIAANASAAPATAALPAPVADALDAARIPRDAVGIVVHDVARARARLAVNADVPMNPASVMKLATTYAALDLLGPGYQWRTEAWAAGALREGVLDGDLVLRGGGDPKLTLEAFWRLLRQIRARGLREIRGDLVLDRSWAAPDGHDPGAFDQQPLRAYNVGPDALLLNFKALELRFLPDAAAGRIEVLVEPQLPGLEVQNLLLPGAGPCLFWRADVRPDYAVVEGRARLTLSGSMPLACGERLWALGVLDHPHYVFGVFAQLWAELGGRFDGRLREGGVPPGATLLAHSESPPLAELVRDVNKLSNNVMARQILLTLSSADGHPASHAAGEAALRAWLVARGIGAEGVVIENGAGLSRRERMSAAQLARLLIDAHRSAVMPEFLASLPLAGVDGTLRKRLGDGDIAGRARLKTGTIDEVKTIAGYVLDRDGRTHAVVFMVNHANAARAGAAQDALVEWVHDGAR